MAEYTFLYVVRMFIEIFAGLVLISTNPIHSVFYLVFVFLLSAFLFIFINCEYIAFTLIIVYVGAISILFLFVVMMLHTKLIIIKEQLIVYLPIVCFMVFIIAIELFSIIGDLFFSTKSNYIEILDNYYVSSNIVSISHSIYSDYSLLFLISALMLFIAMIGAILITFKKTNNVLGNKTQLLFIQHNRSNNITIL